MQPWVSNTAREAKGRIRREVGVYDFCLPVITSFVTPEKML